MRSDEAGEEHKDRGGGFSSLAAALFEAAGPLAYIGAQVAYLAAPLFGGRRDWLADWGRRLENATERAAWIADLWEERERS